MHKPEDHQEELEQFQAYCERQARQETLDKSKLTCPQCSGKGYSRIDVKGYHYIRKCGCRAEQERQELLSKVGIPPLFWKATLAESIVGTGREKFKVWGLDRSHGLAAKEAAKREQQQALNMCRQLRDTYLEVFLDKKKVDLLYGMVLYGDVGRGKTRLAASLLVDLVYAGLKSVRFVEYNDLFKRIRFSYNSSEVSYQKIFESLIQVEVLVIDDFGLEVSGDHVWVLDNIGYIINERYITNRPTILTTNFWTPIEDETSAQTSRQNLYENAAHELSKAAKVAKESEEETSHWERVSYRLRSRIAEMCLQVRVSGSDYRRKMNKNININYKTLQRKSELAD